MKKKMTITKVRKFLSPKEDIDALRIYYCYQIGSTFVNLALMENSIIHGMMMCDRIKVSKTLQEDAPAWQRLAERTDHLQSSTLGNLVGILCRHGLHDADASYLKWVKEKRDFFIHRFFHDEPYPGDLEAPAIRALCRRLRYLECIFQRASQRIWKIFGRAGLMECYDLGPDGIMLGNIGSLDGDNSWLREFVVAGVRRHAENHRRGARPLLEVAELPNLQFRTVID